MADEMISAMTPATEVGNGDLFAIVQGGNNLAATRDLLLTGGTAQDIDIKASAGQDASLQNFGASCEYLADNSGSGQITVSNGFIIALSGTVNAFTLDSIGNVAIECDTNRQCTMGDPAACLLTMNGFAGNCTITGTSAHAISNFDNGAGDWATSPPADYQIAIYRMSALLRTLNGGTPIP